MESEDIYLIDYLTQHIQGEFDVLRAHLPESFENQYNSLRALEEWLVQFKNNLIMFQQNPF